MQGQPKRHHYIPQFFLRSFSIDGKNLWVFDRYKKEYRYQNIRKIASENKFYSYQTQGKKGNLEKLFSQVEGLASPVLKKILSREEITEQEKADFAMFVSVMKVRVPDFKKWTEEGSEKIYKKINQIFFSQKDNVDRMLNKTSLDLSEKEIAELIAFVTDGKRYYVKFPSNYWLGIMLRISLDIAQLFTCMDWKVLFFNKKYALITSDNPVVLIPPQDYDPNSFYGVGLMTSGARTAFSLTPDICLIITDLKEKPTIQYTDIVDKNVFRSINFMTAQNSDRFVYSPDKGKLEKLVKDTKINTFTKAERVKVG